VTDICDERAFRRRGCFGQLFGFGQFSGSVLYTLLKRSLLVEHLLHVAFSFGDIGLNRNKTGNTVFVIPIAVILEFYRIGLAC
jgi:hypothetical protein